MESKDNKDIKEKDTPNRNTGKIIAIVLVAIIAVLGGCLLFFNLNKPTAKDALTSAAKTKITSARSTITVNQTANGKKQSGVMTYEFNKDYTHLVSKFTPKSAGQGQEMWISSKRVYNLDNKKWEYMERNAYSNIIFDSMFSTYKKLFTAHHLDRFSNAGFSALKLSVNGLSGYTINYQGNNKAVLEGLQKASTISGSTDKADISQIKKVDLSIKLNRKKDLKEMNYVVTYKNNASVTVHLYDINGVKNLSLPSELDKAKKIDISNLTGQSN